MARVVVSILVVLGLFSAGCRSTGGVIDEPLRVTRDGSTWVRYRVIPSGPPVNEPFELEVRLFSDAAGLEPVIDAELFVRGYMPDHGHGMVREPEATEREAGVYRVRGMLFHMVGAWTLSFDVVRDGIASSIDYEVML